MRRAVKQRQDAKLKAKPKKKVVVAPTTSTGTAQVVPKIEPTKVVPPEKVEKSKIMVKEGGGIVNTDKKQ